uniref:rRNA 2'-O-methyltransferase fibrillarin n=1 Tax=Amorphochlora amoebiformis TaxID=1561963 RepID=A0A0H5BKF7_9EUKA|nr:fibrillarin like-protein [Amorphochlora amoebiformis]|mmetsp:Transcript_27898/g.44393  ORF Transcript_27898/g.44393 Transcript_27898/m.44393 type:complete len:240 (-) Transcript_27898:673-1392(-)
MNRFQNKYKSYLLLNHKINGIFLIRGIEDCITTKNLIPGSKTFSETSFILDNSKDNSEFRVWNPFRSKISAAVLNGICRLNIKENDSVLYLGASTGSTISHISDIIGYKGIVFAIEKEQKCSQKLFWSSFKRKNIIPVIEDARFPLRYRMIVPVVDIIIIDISQLDQSRILALNSFFYLRKYGCFLFIIKMNSLNSSSPKEIIISKEIMKLNRMGFHIKEQITLEPFVKDHVLLRGYYI